MLEHSKRCRQRQFTPADFSFVVGALSARNRVRPLAKLWEDPDGRRELLDLKDVFQHLLESPDTLSVSPDFYFYVVVRHLFLQADLSDVALAEHVAEVLARRTRPQGDGPLEDLTCGFTHAAPFLSFLSRSTGWMRFHLQVAAGNQFLVLTGLYPRFLEGRAKRGEAPDIGFYEGFASKSFLAAASCRCGADRRDRRTLGLLGEQLPRARRALNRLAEEIVFLGD